MSSERVTSLVRDANDIATFIADTTVSSSKSAKYLAELKVPGIPLLVIDGPGMKKPVLAEFYTADSLIKMLDEARNKIQ